jgi:hypothetical protein
MFFLSRREPRAHRIALSTEPRGIADLGVYDMEAEINWMDCDMATRTESSLANPLIAYQRVMAIVAS